MSLADTSLSLVDIARTRSGPRPRRPRPITRDSAGRPPARRLRNAGPMHGRHKALGLLPLLVLVSLTPACAEDVADSEPSAMSASELVVTRSFQSGVSPSATYAGVADATIRESAPSANEGSSGTISADFDDPAGTRKHTSGLLRFDLASIPRGSRVTSVTLTVNVTNRATGSAYQLYPLARAWNEQQATWQSAATGAPWAAPGARGATDRSSTAIASLAAPATGSIAVTFNAAGVAAVQGWVDDAARNFGFVVDTADNSDGLAFDSSNAATAGNRPKLTVAYDTPPPVSPYPLFTAAEVDAWSTSSPEYTRLAGSWAGNVNRTYAPYGVEVSSTERDVLKDESVYIKTQAVLWAADGNATRRNKVIALLNDLRAIQSWQWDSVEQYRLVAGWSTTNLVQAAAIIGYRDPEFTRFLVKVNYPIMDWPGANNWQASFADSKLAIAVYLNDAALYADAKAYFYERLAQSNWHSAYDGNKVVPVENNDGTPSASRTINAWGGYWGAPQVKSDYTFVNPSYVVDGFNTETIRDLGHVSMGLGAWAHGARTILAHGDTLERHAYDRLRAAYALHAKRVLTYKQTGTIPAPQPVRGDGGGALNQSWFVARRLFGSNTPADVVTLCGHPDVKSYPAGGANHLVAEAFTEGP